MPIVLIGYSDHAYVVCDIFRQMGKQVVGYCDNTKKDKNPDNLEYFGTETDKDVLLRLKNCECFVSIGDNHIRSKVSESLIKEKIRLTNAIHPSAIISNSVKLGKGIMIGPHVVVNACAKIGDGAICNTGSVIEHECVVGEYSHVAPGTVLCGVVNVGKNTLIGAGTVVNLYTKIGNNVIIGAGTVVIKDIPSNLKVAGNPQREL